MTTPAISVVMPAYNARRYIRPAVESILAQSFGDFEFIIIDDGSTDGTTDVLRELAAGDARIRLISRPNTGYTVALREAMTLARAPLIARMDADDLARPHRFAVQVARFQAEPDLVLLGGGYEYIDEADRPIRPFIPATDHATLDAQALAGGNPFCHPLTMFRREAYDRVGGYDPQYEPAEDLDLWLKLAEVGRVSAVPDVLLKYRQHANSVSEKRQARQLAATHALCAAAAERRGIEAKPVQPVQWRSTGSASADLEQRLRFGWWSLAAGHRRSALHFGWRSIVGAPASRAAWTLLACALLNRRPALR